MAETKPRKPRATKAKVAAPAAFAAETAGVDPHAGAMDYPAHERSYDGFIHRTKQAMVIVAIITALVVWIIQ